MKPPAKLTSTRRRKIASAAEAPVPGAGELSLALTFPPALGGPGPAKLGFATTIRSLDRLRPDPVAMDYAIWRMSRLGFSVTGRTDFTATAKISPQQYERLFGTVLSEHKLVGSRNARFLFPADGAPWKPHQDFEKLLDDAYIQWPALPMGTVGPAPIGIFGSSRLYVPDDLRRVFSAEPNRVRGATGSGVRVAMVDSGFAFDHPFFAGRKCSAVASDGAGKTLVDEAGHGTAMSANLLAISPGVDFIGVALGASVEGVPMESLLAGVQTALSHNPRILVLSIAYDFRDRQGNPLTAPPSSCAALATEIQAAVSRGVTVVCAAGNGEFAFPAMLPEVIAVGGAVDDGKGGFQASDVTSAFTSLPWPGRQVPDLCGMAGSRARKAYIMLPCPPGCSLDVNCANLPDGTAVDDGWCFTFGSSAAAPQIAGICALMLEANQSLTPSELKSILIRTADDLTSGNASRQTGGLPAGPGWDGATGAGLANAARCFELI